jgi:EAL domain-containing protein (putative c-di-GMP-specific phosphodiesterase class I)
VALLRFSPPARKASELPPNLLALVAEALGGRRVNLAGQVAYRMSDHRPLHTEILARLRDAAGREVPAAEFIPAVVAQGLDEQLDRTVLEAVLEAGVGEGAISVNLSVRSLESAAFVQWLLPLLQGDVRLAQHLVFEVAEDAVARNEAAVTAFARALASTGAGLALDKFGSRRDSLGRVRRLRPAYIKLAGAHTAAMVSNSGARFYAESLVAAARQLDIPVIAQSVEDESIYQAIAGLGFAGYQGNLGGAASPWPPKV